MSFLLGSKLFGTLPWIYKQKARFAISVDKTFHVVSFPLFLNSQKFINTGVVLFNESLYYQPS